MERRNVLFAGANCSYVKLDRLISLRLTLLLILIETVAAKFAFF